MGKLTYDKEMHIFLYLCQWWVSGYTYTSVIGIVNGKSLGLTTYDLNSQLHPYNPFIGEKEIPCALLYMYHITNMSLLKAEQLC